MYQMTHIPDIRSRILRESVVCLVTHVRCRPPAGSSAYILINLCTAVTGRLAQHSDSAVPSPSLRSREGSTRGGHIFSHSQPPSRQGHSQTQSNRPPSNNLSPIINARDAYQTPPSRSPAQSRAASPLRILQGWNLHRNHTRDEPFIPIDPFRSHIRWFGWRRDGSPSRTDGGQTEGLPTDAQEAHAHVAHAYKRRVCSCLPNLTSFFSPRRDSHKQGQERRKKWRGMISDATFCLSDTMPRQMYLGFLLGLPALYWHRVARVFEDAEVSKPDIQRLIDACGDFAHDPSVDAAIATGFATPTGVHKSPAFQGIPYPEDWTPPVVSPALARFKNSWEQFVDTLMREWKTFNLVSALLCTYVDAAFPWLHRSSLIYVQNYPHHLPDRRRSR